MKQVGFLLLLVFLVCACSSSKKTQQNTTETQTEQIDYTSDNTLPNSDQGVEETSNESAPIIHTVVKGESLWVIAKKYGVTVKQIVAANNIENASLIKIGQKLLIPDKID